MPNPPLWTQVLPPGYPRGYELTVRLCDGRRVQVRPILASDAPELAEAIRTADARTLRARFLGGPPPLTDAVLGALTRLDYAGRFALVARSRGRGVAIARYAGLPPSADGSVAADLAVAVRPEWRRVGLATALVELLARRAQECDITEFTALFMAENRPVTKLALDANTSVVIAEGIAQMHATLSTPHQDWPGHDRLP